MYDWKNPKHKVIGYRVASDVTLKLRDFTNRPSYRQLANVKTRKPVSELHPRKTLNRPKPRLLKMRSKKPATGGTVAPPADDTGELLYASVDVNQNQHCAVMFAQSMARSARPWPRRRRCRLHAADLTITLT